MVAFELLIREPGQPDRTLPLRRALYTIGSASDADIRLSDPLLPPAAATLTHHVDHYVFTALPGTVDVRIDGRRRARHKLDVGDVVSLGACELTIKAATAAALVTTAVTQSDALRNTHVYDALSQFANRLGTGSELRELLRELVDAVINLVKAQKGFLLLTEGEERIAHVARSSQGVDLANALTELSDSIVAKVLATRAPVCIVDAQQDGEFSGSRSVLHLAVTSVVCVPLLHRGRVLGVLYLGKERITQPFGDAETKAVALFAAWAALVIANALLVRELRLENHKLAHAPQREGNLIGASAVMSAVVRTIERVAPTDATVLITGETGTGKELVARELHVRSPRSKGPLVAINCGAIPGSLLESELFGHVRGAFTGAVTASEGKFAAAHGGTIFLDEIGEMSPELQAKLLRVLQERVICKVGDSREIAVDIRVVAATHRDLAAEVSAGRFREDLFYRLNVVGIALPALRERGDDIELLARALLARLAAADGGRVQGFSQAAQRALRRYPWPGNVRELENRLRRAVVLADAALLEPADLGLTDDALPPVLSLAEAKEQFARNYIHEVLALHGGNRTRAAKDLGVDPRTVFRHLEKVGDA